MEQRTHVLAKMNLNETQAERRAEWIIHRFENKAWFSVPTKPQAAPAYQRARIWLKQSIAALIEMRKKDVP